MLPVGNEGAGLSDRQLIETNGNWREKIREIEALLEQLHPQLIDAEADLADRLAEIRAFEFQLRANIEPLTRRIEKLDSEIHNHRQELLRLQVDQALGGDDDAAKKWADLGEWAFGSDSTTASDEFRYHTPQEETPPVPLSEADSATIKQLYWQLARRFHPDLALDDADREYRTIIMKKINAAYAIGDIEQLNKLATEPDSSDRLEFARTDKQLVQALYAELNRCRRRLEEIRDELTRLENHKSAHLLRRLERAAAQGRDLIQEIRLEMERAIANKLIERDVLRQQIDLFGNEDTEYVGNAFADAVLDLSYEGVFEDDIATITARWTEAPDWEDDILDDSE